MLYFPAFLAAVVANPGPEFPRLSGERAAARQAIRTQISQPQQTNFEVPYDFSI
jgi:hypothetical protein